MTTNPRIAAPNVRIKMSRVRELKRLDIDVVFVDEEVRNKILAKNARTMCPALGD